MISSVNETVTRFISWSVSVFVAPWTLTLTGALADFLSSSLPPAVGMILALELLSITAARLELACGTELAGFFKLGQLDRT